MPGVAGFCRRFSFMSYRKYISVNSHAIRLCVLIFLATGCVGDDGGPLTVPPQHWGPGPVPTPTTPPPAFPPLSRAGQIYRAPDTLYDGYVTGQSLASRYVLYDGGEFSLQFASVRNPFFEYRGHYTSTANAVLTFTFDDDARWGATATLSGDSMTVRYNDISSLTDFLDGVYIRWTGP
jgi:hypothetical protein